MIGADQIKEKLLSNNLRVTHQRIIIYDTLTKTHEHPTAEQIYHQLKDDHPSLSLATVYKTLDTFVRYGLIKKLWSKDGAAHFDADLTTHFHLICSKTGRITDYFDEELEQILSTYFAAGRKDNFQINRIDLNIIGETIN